MHRLSSPSVKNIFLIHITIIVQKQLERCCPWEHWKQWLRAFWQGLLVGLRLQRICAELVEDLKDLTISCQSLEISHLDARLVSSPVLDSCAGSQSCRFQVFSERSAQWTPQLCRASCGCLAWIVPSKPLWDSNTYLVSQVFLEVGDQRYLRKSLTTEVGQQAVMFTGSNWLSSEQRFAETGQRSSVSVKHCFWSMNPWWVVASSWTVATSFTRFQPFRSYWWICSTYISQEAPTSFLSMSTKCLEDLCKCQDSWGMSRRTEFNL